MYVMPEAKLEYLPKWIFVHKLICNVELCYYNVEYYHLAMIEWE